MTTPGSRSRLRYTKATGRWAIYWRDRNLELHEYNRKRPTKNIQALLDHIETSGDPIFWGWRAVVDYRYNGG